MKHLAALIIIAATFATASAQFTKLIGPDGWQEDYFGSSVAISGNTIVVGAPGDNHPSFPNIDIGGAYVYVTNGTQWTLQQYLLGSNLTSQCAFGQSVGIDGDVIVVGAPFNSAGGSTHGAAYVIERFGTSWFETALLNSPVSQTPSLKWFGYSVAVSRDTIVVGDPIENIGSNENQGAAYVFVRSGNTWVQQAKLTAADGKAGDQFGRSVAISGDRIIVGAIYDPPRGSAYVFSRQGTIWTERARLTGGDGLSGEFGNAVAISGTTAVVGAPGSTIIPGGPITGAGYVYAEGSSGWTEQSKLIPSTPSSLGRFGSSVSISSGLIIVGAESTLPIGATYLFQRRSGSWNAAGQFAAFSITNGAEFGSSVAVSKGKIVAGARRDDIQSRPDQGSAFVGTGLNYNSNIGGRVIGLDGRGVSNVPVTLTNSQDVTRYAMTNPFGYYRFVDVPAIQTYTLSIASKRFSYAPRMVTVDEDRSDLDFTP